MTDARFDSTVTTTCGYCGVGCRLEAHTRAGRVVSISPGRGRSRATAGHTCLKGRFAHQFSRSRERLTHAADPRGRAAAAPRPGRRRSSAIADELGRIKAAHGPDAIAGLASSRATNEDCYAMQRMMRAAIGTNNIDNCSRVCHSPTSFALRQSLGYSGRDRLVRRHRARGRGDPHRREPDRGPSGRRRADQAGGAARPAARDDRPAADRARRPRGGAPRAAARHERRRRARARARRPPRRPRRPRVRRRAHRGLRGVRGAARALRPRARCEEITRRAGGGPRARPRTSTPRRREASHPLGPRRHRAQVRLRGRAADLQPGADDRQGRAPGLRAAPAARPEQRAGLVRHGRAARTRTPATGAVDDEEVARAFEAALGRDAVARARAEDPARCSTPPSPASSRRCTSSARTSRRPTRTPRTSSTRSSRSSSSSARTSSRPRRRSYADVVLPASSFLEKTGTFTNAERRIQLVAAGDRPARATRAPTSTSCAPCRAALGHDMGLDGARGRDGRDRGAHARASPASRTSASGAAACSGRSPPTAPTRRSSTSASSTAPGGRAHFAALPVQGAGRRGRRRVPARSSSPAGGCEHYNAGTMTRRTGEPRADGPRLARDPPRRRRARSWIADGDVGLGAQPRRARSRSRARVTERIEPGHVFTAFHFPEVRTNLLIGSSADVNTSCPEYKVVAVDVRPVDRGAGAHAGARRGLMSDADIARMVARGRARRRAATRSPSRSRWRSASTASRSR